MEDFYIKEATPEDAEKLIAFGYGYPGRKRKRR